MSPFHQSVVDHSVFLAVFLDLSPRGLFRWPRCSEVSPMATLDSWIKCPEAG